MNRKQWHTIEYATCLKPSNFKQRALIVGLNNEPPMEGDGGESVRYVQSSRVTRNRRLRSLHMLGPYCPRDRVVSELTSVASC